MVGVILAAGNGNRLKSSICDECCKPLIEINNKRLIEYSLDNLVDLGIDAVYVVVGKEGDLIKETIGEEYNGIKIHYTFQQQQKGLVNAFAQTFNELNNNDVILQLADEIFIDFKAKDIKNHFERMSYDFYCGITYENNTEKIKNNFSVDIDSDSIITRCTEKPSVVMNNIKGTGFCIFKNNTLRMLSNKYDEKDNFPYDLCDFINYLVSEDQKGFVFCVAEKEFNINTFDDLIEAQEYMFLNRWC